MLTELGKRVDENSENFNKELGNILKKKKTSQLKNTITEIKNWIEWINGKLGDIEECTGDLEDRIIKITRSEQHSNSCPLSRWCHPAISSSVVPFSSCPQSLPASESFPMSQLFAWGGQSIGVSALASFPPKNTQGWSPLEWTGWISLHSKGLSRVLSNTTVQKHISY